LNSGTYYGDKLILLDSLNDRAIMGYSIEPYYYVTLCEGTSKVTATIRRPSDTDQTRNKPIYASTNNTIFRTDEGDILTIYNI
jgi:hypothetical protein